MLTKVMKPILSCAMCISMLGCSQLVLNQACDDAAELKHFPNPNAIAHIDVSFDILVLGETKTFSERAVCEYQGSMCPAGEWYEVWYGDRSASYEIDLTNGEKLTIWPHSLCIDLNEFREKCLVGQCNPEEQFEFRLVLSDERKVARERECESNNPDGTTDNIEEFVKCAMPGVDLVTFGELEKYGYEVENAKTVVAYVGI